MLEEGRTAVVFIHGIGEPVPFEGLDAFASVVINEEERHPWKTSPDPVVRFVGRDAALGLTELPGITSRRMESRGSVDFYEMYWADIMDQSSFAALRDWLAVVLFRENGSLPRDSAVLFGWIALWVVVLSGTLFAFAVAFPKLSLLLVGPVIPEIFRLGLEWLRGPAMAVYFGAIIVAIVVRLVVTRGKPGNLFPLFFAAMFGAVIYMLPPSVIGDWELLAPPLAALGAFVLYSVIVPLIGDVASYVRATPRTLDRRRRVLERGLHLLESLHAKRRGDSDHPAYERIVLVGHSLGSMIAYDLLQIYWQRNVPTKQAMDDPGLKHAVTDLENFTRTQERDRFNLAAFKDRQDLVFSRLRDVAGWRISDLVTLGSPLAHPDVVLQDLERDRTRAFSTLAYGACPPVVTGQLHQASQFSAVRWTNLYDRSANPLFGDLISGPVSPIFGPGITDMQVTIVRNGFPWPLKRLATHTEYWSDSSGDKANPPQQIAALRMALALEGRSYH